MIINESSKQKSYEEFEIKDPKKFISAIDNIIDSSKGLTESDDYDLSKFAEDYKDEIRAALKMNKMSAPPTRSEIEKSGSKFKVPWFLVGTLLNKAKNYGLEKKFKERYDR